MNKNSIILVLAGLIILVFSSCRKSEYVTEETIILKDEGGGIGTLTLKEGKRYLVDGFVFVNEGQVLTIEPGAIIRFKTGTGENTSALIVCRGGKIIAEGTESKPIIFTAESDDLNGNIPLQVSGLWGGIIILGNAPINAYSTISRIEGVPIYDERTEYGGNNPDDDSGILKYVSIRHAGSLLTPGNEINGLTLGGVGRGTTIEFVEVISNSDDGFEFFGGTVNCRYLISAFCEDDAFDFDDGYIGNCQFLLAIQTNSAGDFLIEHDGGYNEYINCTKPTIANATVIGRGITGNRGTILFRNGSGGIYKNSLFINQAWGVNIQYENTNHDAFSKFLNGTLKIENNIFYYIGYSDDYPLLKLISNTQAIPQEKQEQLNSYFHQAGNLIKNPGIRIENNGIYIIPESDVSMPLLNEQKSWFIPTDYAGAFKNVNWTEGWSYLYQKGFIK
ncbi:MAG TPA: hypothetical protein PK285_08265 [Bacteroidales bacterium]|jgi:hypothetical protein|nr:hypothetical protein [Bacteroidales bacterium]HOL97641.1 hypothetical protein [Bacteroidales bacterium]HPD24377.1 hypothetical protein [Bacteroidales bacterium]HUM32904.1 hypothetical protein [Bacteroidales bacterium]